MFVIELFGSFYDLLFYFDQFDPEVQLFASHFMIGIEGDGRFFFCRHFRREWLTKLVRQIYLLSGFQIFRARKLCNFNRKYSIRIGWAVGFFRH